jgi:hypothetical protein
MLRNHLRECQQIPITAPVETPEVIPMTPLRSPESISVWEPTKEQKRDFDLLYEACEQSGVVLEPPRGKGLPREAVTFDKDLFSWLGHATTPENQHDIVFYLF